MRALLSALAFTAFLAGGTASAQGPQGPGGPMMGPMMGQRMMGPMTGSGPMMGSGAMMMDPSQHVEGRLAFLKAELKITEAQTQQWIAFAEAFRANAQRMGELWGSMATMMGHDSMSGSAGPVLALPDRLDLMEKHLATHLEMARAIKGPATELYTALSDDQKRVANTLLHGPMGLM